MRHLICLVFFLSNTISFPTELGLPGSTGDPVFELLEPSRSGVKFRNDLKDTKEDNIMIYSNFYGGSGVAIGDLNGDGLQ